MKISNGALEQIDTLRVRLALASALQFTETWIRELINKNKENGPLTTAQALQVIEQETGLSQEEILETVTAS